MRGAVIYIAYALVIIAFLATACYMHSMALDVVCSGPHDVGHWRRQMIHAGMLLNVDVFKDESLYLQEELC